MLTLHFKFLKMTKLTCFIVLTFLFCSFSYAQISEELVSYRLVEAKHVPFSTEDFSLIISIDSSKVVTAKSTKKHKTSNLAIDEAYFNAIIENEIDLLVNPITSVKKTNQFLFFFGGYAEAQVTGYAAYFKQAITKDELNQLNNQKTDQILKQLAEFAKKHKQETKEEKEFITVENCNGCKEGDQPLRLLVVRTKKKSILDSYIESIK